MRPTIALPLAVALLTVASASHADVIHACVAKANGKLRIVANEGMCKASESALSWEQSPPPPAPPVPPFKFVGFTTATVGSAGNFQAGILEWTRACAAEFTGARACKSDEVIFSAVAPQITNPDELAWVIPVFIAANTDVSGFQNFGNCAVLANGGSGLVVDGHGRYNNATCTDAHRVACCAPSK